MDGGKKTQILEGCTQEVNSLLYMYFIWLVVWNMFYCPFHIWDVVLPIDELIFFNMVKTC